MLDVWVLAWFTSIWARKSFNAIDNIALVSNQKSYHSDTNNLRQKILKKMDEIGLSSSDIPVGLLSVAEQQKVEILKF